MRETQFESDDYHTDIEKNSGLAALLAGAWQDLAILKIERVDTNTSHGWRVTYQV